MYKYVHALAPEYKIFLLDSVVSRVNVIPKDCTVIVFSQFPKLCKIDESNIRNLYYEFNPRTTLKTFLSNLGLPCNTIEELLYGLKMIHEEVLNRDNKRDNYTN